eukprot:TRINITY_DN13341_c0_g5_i1.p1 TRINITY_DN13341_c0_g5~~TRINITY_DN13341_c0_g5_i1.p1  ORF type:complete len:196 (+),score=39.68 TRINITY_DN13341_c0_g5_i1:301-888(+)
MRNSAFRMMTADVAKFEKLKRTLRFPNEVERADEADGKRQEGSLESEVKIGRAKAEESEKIYLSDTPSENEKDSILNESFLKNISALETRNNKARKLLKTQKELKSHIKFKRKDILDQSKPRNISTQMFIEMHDYVANCLYFDAVGINYEHYLRTPNGGKQIKKLIDKQEVNKIKEKLSEDKVYRYLIEKNKMNT